MQSHYKPDAIIALASAIREQANTFILNALAGRGITDVLPAHGAVLNALFKESPLQMNRLAERIDRKRNTVTGLISTLEERGYCRRAPDPDDARAQLVFLTEKGAAMRRIQEKISTKLLRKVWGSMSAAEQAACVRSLEAVLRNLQQD